MLHSGKGVGSSLAQPPGSCSRDPEVTGEYPARGSLVALGTCQSVGWASFDSCVTCLLASLLSLPCVFMTNPPGVRART